MFETFLILFGVVSALGVLVVLYPVCLYIKLKKHEKKVKEVYLQIKAQVDIKCELLISGITKKKKTDILERLEKLGALKIEESYSIELLMTKEELVEKLK